MWKAIRRHEYLTACASVRGQAGDAVTRREHAGVYVGVRVSDLTVIETYSGGLGMETLR